MTSADKECEGKPMEASQLQGSQAGAASEGPLDFKTPSNAELLGNEKNLLDADVELEGVRKILEMLKEDEIDLIPDLRMPIRHLRAQKGNVSKAADSIRDTLKWRTEFQIQRLLKCVRPKQAATTEAAKGEEQVEDDVEFRTMMEAESETGKNQVRNYTKEGRAVLFLDNSRNNTKNDVHNMRALAWNIEKAVACTRRKSKEITGKALDKYCIVIDFSAFSLRAAPSLSVSKETLTILQERYPERIYRIFLIHVPMSFRIFWNLVKPFIDPVTKEKVCFCTPGSNDMKRYRDEFTEEGFAQLEACCGGNESAKDFNAEAYLELPFDAAYVEI